jgi:small multidrug resistance pump
MGWLFLAGAIACEIFGTILLRYSKGFTVWQPTLGMIALYVSSFYLLSRALKTVQLSTAYAIWSAVGTAVIAVVGVLAFGEHLTAVKAFGILAIIAGVVALNLGGAH